MRGVRKGLYLGILLLPGCSVGERLATNLVIEPAHFDRYSDHLGRCLRDKHLAHEAWDEVCLRDGEVYSRHYYRGFVEGFMDYLEAGGTGDPPVTPPRSYWRLYYQTPEGHQAIQDWFAGFRHGADIAKASGVRELVTVPVSTIPPSEISDITGGTTTEAGLPAPPSGTPPTDREKLPAPAPAPAPGIKPPVNEGPVTPPKTANGRPMPPPTPPVIQVERMIAPPVKKPQ